MRDPARRTRRCERRVLGSLETIHEMRLRKRQCSRSAPSQNFTRLSLRGRSMRPVARVLRARFAPNRTTPSLRDRSMVLDPGRLFARRRLPGGACRVKLGPFAIVQMSRPPCVGEPFRSLPFAAIYTARPLRTSHRVVPLVRITRPRGHEVLAPALPHEDDRFFSARTALALGPRCRASDFVSDSTVPAEDHATLVQAAQGGHRSGRRTGDTGRSGLRPSCRLPPGTCALGGRPKRIMAVSVAVPPSLEMVAHHHAGMPDFSRARRLSSALGRSVSRRLYPMRRRPCVYPPLKNRLHPTVHRARVGACGAPADRARRRHAHEPDNDRRPHTDDIGEDTVIALPSGVVTAKEESSS